MAKQLKKILCNLLMTLKKEAISNRLCLDIVLK